MVSLRRRRLLGLCSGERNSFLAPFPRFCDNRFAPENAQRNTNAVSVHPLLLGNMIKPAEVIESLGVSSNISGSGSSKELKNVLSPVAGPEVKRRKLHRRKHINNQEQCVMRGVYYKNMKWQAAIKVDKKQIHLGTVGSQEEAAHLYDRAAFMCGREPNFKLSEEEKKELQTYNWDDFLAMTRRSITSKKTKRRYVTGSRIKPEPSVQNSYSDGDQAAEDGSSAADDAEEEDASS